MIGAAIFMLVFVSINGLLAVLSLKHNRAFDARRKEEGR